MKEQPICPECGELMIYAELCVGHERVYLDSHSGEEATYLNAWVCPQCRQVLLVAANPENLGDAEDSFSSPPSNIQPF